MTQAAWGPQWALARARRGRALATIMVIGVLAAVAWLSAAPAAAQDAPPAPAPAPEVVARGRILFTAELTPEQGLGPLYNETSCAGCHLTPRTGGMGRGGLAVVTRVGRQTGGTFDPLLERGGPIARAHAISELGASCSLTPGVPAEAALAVERNTPGLFGLGLIDQIPDEVILAGAIAREDGTHGRPHLVIDAGGRQRVGRFGWKADTATLEQFSADALRNEHGITSPLASVDLLPPNGQIDTCSASTGNGAGSPEMDGADVAALTAFVASLPAPTSPAHPTGEALFAQVGCASCHTPSLSTPNGEVRLYSDLLLHDMGAPLNDGIVQGQAGGRDWRTTPLWGLRERERFLHDGRARSIEAAIGAHRGEAALASDRYTKLSREDRAMLLHFLQTR
ncbi:MAG: hypothetical protein IT306_24880 [Chloroflexi bacterium]|nr:hypothetical protein [Chloroflexota bacterium]